MIPLPVIDSVKMRAISYWEASASMRRLPPTRTSARQCVPARKGNFFTVIGAVINSAGIVAGGVCALAFKKPLPHRFQWGAKIVLGSCMVWFGLQLTWRNLNGSVVQFLKELCIVLLAMALGKLIGRVLRLQDFSNSIGQYATRSMTPDGNKKRFGDGFLVATALFCAGPLSVLASVPGGVEWFFVVVSGEGRNGWFGDDGVLRDVWLGRDGLGDSGAGISRIAYPRRGIAGANVP